MDDSNLLRDSWTWMDEGSRLDVGSPLAMSDFIWDDLVENEAVVRSLFPSSPIADHFKDPAESFDLSLERQDSPDCNTAPLKRRRLLELNEDNLMDISSCLPEPLEASNDFLVAVCEDLQRLDPLSSGSAAWYTNEESLSSVDDTIEQSSGSWRIGCISDSDTSDVPELVPCPANLPINIRTTTAKVQNNSGLKPRTTKRTMSCMVSNGVQQIHRQQTPNKVMNSAGNRQCMKSRQDIVNISPRSKEPALIQPSKDCPSTRECAAIPVLVYPFALVKPIGIQGDVTLQDINHRINSSSGRVVNTCLEQSKNTPSSSSYSGKSVLALTKIYTEGNGTITIMRTKG